MIIFIADFFVEQVNGGGELANEEVIKHLLSKDIHVEKKNSHEVTEEYLLENTDKFFIVANFVNLQSNLLPLFENLNYVIYEHDHKYVNTRNPSVFKNHLAPYESLINESFYKTAKAVLCQSKIHSEVVAKNLLLNNVVSLGCSLWSQKTLDHIESVLGNTKNKKTVVVKSPNKIKGTYEAKRYCEKNDIDYEAIGSPDYYTFLNQLSQSESLVFFPTTLESFCRLAVEARMLGCKLITNENIGATSEEWFGKKGQDLINFIRGKQSSVLQTFIDVFENKELTFIESPKIPKISIITSVYKADAYIKEFLEDITRQTIFDNCELILINANSPQNEEEIIKDYLEKHDNIVYKKLDEDPGVYGVWNLGIEMSTGDFITNANVDDRRSFKQLEVLSRELVNDESIDLVYSQCFITEKANETFDDNSSGNKVYATGEFTKENMIKCLPGCMPLWRKSLHSAGQFNANYKHAGDWEMWLRAARSGATFKKVNGTHGLYYVNPDGLSTSEKARSTRFKEEKETFFEYKDMFGEENFNKFKVYFEQ